MNKPLLWFVPVFVLVLVICVAFARTASDAPYLYDESDYMYAGTQGFWANFTDQHAISLFEFIRKGRELSRDKSQRSSISQFARSSGDISFYRHYHGPLYAYWLSLGHAVGLRSEREFRASGLVFHALGATAIFWLFLLMFPELSLAGALAASIAFALNRTALVAATSITQHIVFEFVSILVLAATAMYLRTGRPGWWTMTSILLACAFAAVEIAIVLIGIVLLSLILARGKDGPRKFFVLLGRGSMYFAGTLALLWPFGVLQLNAIKGYLYLAYMAIFRKTFTPIGPVDLWTFRITTYPFEFAVPIVAAIFVIWNWRTSSFRAASVPWILYTLGFLAVTMVITAPFTYYHASLLASASVLVGIAFGDIWRKQGPILGSVAGAAGVVCLLLSVTGFYGETELPRKEGAITRAILDQTNPAPSATLFTPFEHIPALHYYRPEVVAVGYDTDWSAQRIAEQAVAAAPSIVICRSSLCRDLEALIPERVSATRREMSKDPLTNEAYNRLDLRKR